MATDNWNLSVTTSSFSSTFPFTNYSVDDVTPWTTSSFDFDDSPRYPAVRQAAWNIMRYLYLIVVIIGVTGNAIAALVLVRPRMRTTSIYAYLLALSVADTVILLVSALKTWVRVVTNVEWLHASEAACRTLMYLFVVALHMSAWLIVLLTFDRFIAVWLPLRAFELCTVHRARLLIVGLMAFMLVVNSHLFGTIHLYKINMESETDADGNQTFFSSSTLSSETFTVEHSVTTTTIVASYVVHQLRCAPLPDSVFANETFNYIKLSTYSVIPFIIVLLLNLGIIWRAVRVASSIRRSYGGSTRPLASTGSSGRGNEENPNVLNNVVAPPPTPPSIAGRSSSSGGGRHYNTLPATDADDKVDRSRDEKRHSDDFYRCDKEVTAYHGRLRPCTVPYTGNGYGNSTQSKPPPPPQRKVATNAASRSKATSTAPIVQSAHLTTMLMTISFSWLALTTLFTIHSVLGVSNYNPSSPDVNLILKTIGFLLMYINHSTNLFLYCLTGRRFRHELRALVLCCINRHRRRSMTAGTALRMQTVGGGGGGQRFSSRNMNNVQQQQPQLNQQQQPQQQQPHHRQVHPVRSISVDRQQQQQQQKS